MLIAKDSRYGTGSTDKRYRQTKTPAFKRRCFFQACVRLSLFLIEPIYFSPCINFMLPIDMIIRIIARFAWLCNLFLLVKYK